MTAKRKLDLRNPTGGVNFDQITELLDIEKNELAQMIDYDRTSLKENKPASPKMLATLSPIFRILAILWDHFDGDTVKISTWLHEPKADWIYLSPIEMMKRKKSDKVVEYLTSLLDLRSDIFNG